MKSIASLLTTRFFIKYFLLIGCLAPSVAMAWNSMGHMLVAQISYEFLTPRTKKEVDLLTRSMTSNYPKVNHFVAGAPWPDDIKSSGIREYNTWHYITLGFSNDGTHFPQAPTPNVLTGIEDSINYLKNPKLPTEERAHALMMLIHLVGDLHQPMHTATRFSKNNPDGDAGGNAFILKGKYKNLHALWDASLGAYTNNISRPLSPISQEILHDKALLLIATFFNPKDTRLKKSSVTQWAQESHQVALDYAYYGIRKNTHPSKAYKAQGMMICNDQITLAGVRLALILNQVLDGQP